MFVAALKRLKPTISANASVPKDGIFNKTGNQAVFI
jgi:hypothetical protein